MSGSENFYNKMIELTKENLPPNYDELQGDEKQEAFEKAEDKALNWWLKLDNEKLDEETPSPQEVASSVCTVNSQG